MGCILIVVDIHGPVAAQHLAQAHIRAGQSARALEVLEAGEADIRHLLTEADPDLPLLERLGEPQEM